MEERPEDWGGKETKNKQEIKSAEERNRVPVLFLVLGLCFGLSGPPGGHMIRQPQRRKQLRCAYFGSFSSNMGTQTGEKSAPRVRSPTTTPAHRGGAEQSQVVEI